MIWLLMALVLQVPGRPLRPSAEWRFEGHWRATITDRGKPVVLSLTITPIGRIPATLGDGGSGGAQRASGVGFDATGEIRLAFNAGTTILARLRPSGKALDATIERHGTTHHAVFTRVPGPAGPPRPQTPKPPYPYDSFNLSIDTGSGVLAGTLSLPRGRGPFPAVVLLSGTGPDDRDGAYAGHRPFFVIADYLTRRGFGVLRLDDRGSGQSSGLFGELRTVEADAFDAIAAVRFLRERPEIDARRIGLVGFSEGGTVAPVAAAEEPGISFLVLLGAPAMDGGSIGILQHAAIERARGTPEPIIESLRPLREAVYEAFRTESDTTRAHAKIRDMIDHAAAGADDATKAVLGRQAFAFARLMQRHAVVFRQRMLFDPLPVLRALKIPVLALYGSLDVQVPADANAPRMREAIAGSSPRTSVKVLPGLNHAFQTAKTGSVDEYWQIEETFAPAALEVMGLWLARVTAR